MVFGNIRDLKDYSWLEEEVLKCFKYAQEHDLMAYEKGSHEIDGDDLFVNIVEYETTTPQNRFLLCYPKDAHRTAVAVDGPAVIKKAIFKIKIK